MAKVVLNLDYQKDADREFPHTRCQKRGCQKSERTYSGVSSPFQLRVVRGIKAERVPGM